MTPRANLPRRLKELREHFATACREDVPGLLAARTYAAQILAAFQKAFREDAIRGESWALVAVGGFGRGELSFFSDLDLLFLYKKRIPAHLQESMRELIYGLWDSGFEVGNATASISSIKKSVHDDFTILTNYLESRFIAGDPEFFGAWKKSFHEYFGNQNKRRFLEKLVAYRDTRMNQFAESTYLLEPHVKDGVGGLRDIHTLRWAGLVYLQDPSLDALLRKDLLDEAEKLWLDQAYDFLWRVRLQLHQINGRRQDQLLFPEQEQIADRLGCMSVKEMSGVESFMRLYYRHTSRIRRTLSFFLERIQESRKGTSGLLKRRRILPGPFLLEGKHLHFMDPEWVQKDPGLLMRFFWQASQSGAHFHHHAGKIIRENLGGFGDRQRRDPELLRQFFDILLDGEHAFIVLKVMLETAFLQTFIPELAAVRYRVQNDAYHVYTVDEHLLRTVRELHRIEQANARAETKEAVLPFKFEIKPKNRRILYLAALLHDIGKGRGKNHAVQGSLMAEEIAERMQLDAKETSLFCFLIRHHLLLAEIALKRDLMDPKPIAQCAIEIKDRERLLLLYLLTIADSKATGTGAWNTWKASLLRELFFRVDRTLFRGDLQPEDTEARTAEVRESVLKLLPEPADAGKLCKWLDQLTPRYLLSQNPEAIIQHFRLEDVLADRAAGLRAEPVEGEMWQITVAAHDRPGLFALITGVLWARGLNILAADIYTHQPGVACDILIVEKIPDPLHPDDLWSKVENDLVCALEDPAHLENILQSRRKPSLLLAKNVPRKDDRVIVDEEASDSYTLIEVYTWDRPGVLHSITDALYRLDLTIQLAKISTPGAQVADVFYVTDLSGGKLMDFDRHERIRQTLLRCLSEI
ncbi:MAG: [protein-PII] uridylyltransferase [Desulfobacteraceae bacterium]|nr:[protein-PII] uridylyltransferase [Desulfobacteraceae bacterium]